MLEKIVQIKSIGRVRDYSDILEPMLPWLLSGEIRIKDAKKLTGGLV